MKRATQESKMLPNCYDLNDDYPLTEMGSWPKTVHRFDKRSADALVLAEATQRPLLVKGEPGVGKSQLARAAAVARNRLFLSIVVNARTESSDLLWQFDAVGRLSKAQMLGNTTTPDNLKNELAPEKFITPGPLWWAYNWDSACKQYKKCESRLAQKPIIQSSDWEPTSGTVLLIDEIDKADTELPNSLLEVLGNNNFELPDGTPVRQSKDVPAPLIVITTNEERELPMAFVRRCVVLTMGLHTERERFIDQLCERGAIHYPETTTDAIRRKAAEYLWADRSDARDHNFPPPGQAEYLDLLRGLTEITADEKKQEKWLDWVREFVFKKYDNN